MRGLADIYTTLFRTDLAVQFQYRAAMVIWLIGRIVDTLVFLSVWTAVARSQGGQVGDFSSGDFAAYYIIMMMMGHLTFTWFMFEFEYRVRSGAFSPLLLQPLHPIHRDIATNISYKFLTLAVMLPTVGLMIWIFDPVFDPPTWAIWAAIPVVLLAFLMRFFVEWALALVALWTTRTAAANQLYFAASLFFSGQMAPLSLLPEWLQSAGRDFALPLDAGLSHRTPARSAHAHRSALGRGSAGGVAGAELGNYGRGLVARRAQILGGRLVNYLRLLWIFLRIGAMNELAYQANFWVQLVQSLLNLGVALAGLAVIFSHTEELGGWQPAELVALLGVFFLMSGLIGALIQPSMQRFMEDIRLGTLDFTLTKPEDAQVLVSVGEVRIWKFLDVVQGMALIAVALVEIGMRAGLVHAAGFALTLAAGAAIVYSFWLVLATTAFWFIRAENILVIFQAVYSAGKYPVAIYPRWLKLAMTFLVPVAFAVTVPSEALVGRLSSEVLWGALAMAAGMLVGARAFWLWGVRHYSGASA